MLEIFVPETEVYNNVTEEFVATKSYQLKLEHSLLSVAKWEAKHHKVFLSKGGSKTTDETFSYIQCMCLQYEPTIEQLKLIPGPLIKQITEYIHDPMTATWFSEDKSRAVGRNKRNNEVTTSEVIYYQMVELGVWKECEKWHLNRLLTLIQVISLKRTPPKKRSKKDILNEQQMLNEQRKRQLGTKG